jgi:hypothetical protein
LTTQKYSPDKEAGVVRVKYFLARRVRTDQRWDAGVGVGVGGEHLESNATEGRSLDVDRRSLGRVYSSTGVELDINREEDSRGETSGTV